MLYFQGTDNKLWGLNVDGSGGTNIGGYKTSSTPVAFGSNLYFQGTDHKLWKTNLDGSHGVDLGGYATNSTPFLTTSHIYFQGTDNKLWQVALDGSGGTNLGGYKTKSTPYAFGEYVYFQGTDDKLWRVLLDGTQGVNLGGYKTASTPFVTAQHVYFRGTDSTLWQINIDGTHGVHLGGYKTNSMPFVTASNVYFQGTDDKLWRINLDGSGGTNLAGYKTKSTPVVGNGYVFFQGTDNALWRLNLDGSHGVHLGNFNTASTPFVVDPTNQPVTGSLLPRYFVLTMVYSPPGTDAGAANPNSSTGTSSVDYGSSSSTGTTTTTASSFQDSVSVGVGIGGGDKDIGSLGADFSYSKATSDSVSVEVKKTASFDIKVPGPAANGIDHSRDRFYLWLNPMVDVTIDPQNNLAWELGVNGPTMIIQYVEVGWLQNPSTMQPGVKAQLDKAGLTAGDYREILALNPFASGATTIDPNRFVPLPQSFPYEAPDNANDSISTSTYVLQNSVTNTRTTQVQYTTNFSVSGGLNLLIFKLKSSASLQWTNTSSTTNTNAATQSATAVIGGPSFGYTGPTDVLAYIDTVYNSFMFALPTDPPVAVGTITNALGKAMAHQQVTLTVGGTRLNTYTDSKGGYRFYGKVSGSGTVSVAGKAFPVPVGAGSEKATLQLS
ncbi:MAG: DUF5050 domain-containing protein [Alphaproteobacteria bacterium]|nr:DUF5050 domain-containing protein [Alphaproteobacteria bacterium]